MTPRTTNLEAPSCAQNMGKTKGLSTDFIRFDWLVYLEICLSHESENTAQ